MPMHPPPRYREIACPTAGGHLPEVKGDSLKVEVSKNGDTLFYEHSRNDPRNMYNYWKEYE